MPMTDPNTNAWGNALNARFLRVVTPPHPVGSVVVLNSDGPFMTVQAHRDDLCECAWIVRSAELQNAYPAACLTRVSWLDRLFRALGAWNA